MAYNDFHDMLVNTVCIVYVEDIDKRKGLGPLSENID